MSKRKPKTKRILIVQFHDGSKHREFQRFKEAFDYGCWLAMNMRRKPLITTAEMPVQP